MASTSSPSATAATASPVSPRKGRHARSQAMVNSISAISSTSTSADRRASLLGGAQSTLGLPPGVDPLTLDPDEALMRFSVREVQAIEASLRSSHDTLTTRLRTLVSERYRDMLGTANTLIEMSDSSTHLVQRLDGVLDGVQRAGKAAAEDGTAEEGAGGAGLTGLLVGESKVHDTAVRQQNEERAALFAVAATSKLIAEAPDEVWKAIDAATQASETGVVTVSASSSKKQALKGRELSDFQAATILRAAWIFTLAEASWTWLTAPAQLFDAGQQFPFVARQLAALTPMRSYIVSASTAGLAGWMEAPSTTAKTAATRWDDVSASYLATITSLISLALLEGSSLQGARDRLLQSRAVTLQDRLRSSRSTAAHGEKLVHLVHFVSDTMLHTLKAFALPPSDAAESATPSTQPHLATIYARLHKTDEAAAHSFPPLALSVLHTLPSATILTQHLPEDIRMYALHLADEESNSLPDDTLCAVRAWVTSVLNDSLDEALSRTVESLTTIAAISEVQSTLWASVDRCCAQGRKTCSGADATHGEACASFVEQTLHALVARIDGLLMRRLNSICQAYGDQLSSAVIEGTREALEHFDSANGVNEAEEVEPALFLFESSMTVDASTIDALERKLRMRTKHVQDILTLAEEKANAFASETRVYSSSIRRAEARRLAQRRAEQQQQSSDAGPDHAEQGRRESGQEMLASFDASLQRAKTSIARALGEIAQELTQNEQATTTARLFLARLVSALRRSSVFTAAKRASDDEQGLAKDLQAVQHSLLDAWVTSVVGAAVRTYAARSDAFATPTDALPQSASAALLDALAVLSRGVQAAGVGYYSEATWLRSRLTAAFATQWLEGGKAQMSAQRLFDVETLTAIAGLRDNADGSLDDDRAAARATLRQARVDGLRTTDVTEARWSSHCATYLQTMLARVRLIVAGIVVDEALFATASTKGTTTTASVPPPLPMLRLAKARESIPRIRSLAATAASR